MVAALKWLNSLRVRVIWKVVLLSRPVLISSRNKVFLGPTSNSPEAAEGVESVCTAYQELLLEIHSIPWRTQFRRIIYNCIK